MSFANSFESDQREGKKIISISNLVSNDGPAYVDDT